MLSLKLFAFINYNMCNDDLNPKLSGASEDNLRLLENQ